MRKFNMAAISGSPILFQVTTETLEISLNILIKTQNVDFNYLIKKMAKPTNMELSYLILLIQ